MKGRIAEIFESIQGEGLYFGERQLFVRFFGCNLACKFCDTPLSRYIEYEPQELLDKLKSYKGSYHSVSFTGGEPLMQAEFLREILTLTRQGGFRNYLETNGTLPEALEPLIDYVDIVAMDLKFPSSTDMNGYWDAHRQFLKISSSKEVFLKAVICKSTQEKDLKMALKVIKEINEFVVLILQPNSYDNHKRMLRKIGHFREICVQNGVTTCIIPQMHKIARFR